MLLWFVDKKVAELALKQAVLIEEEHVECRPERITDAVVDENVDIHLIRKYFAYDAWLLVEQVLTRKQKKMTWICKICHQDLHAKTSGPSIVCELCLLWLPFCLCWSIKAAEDKELVLRIMLRILQVRSQNLIIAYYDSVLVYYTIIICDVTLFIVDGLVLRV